MTNVVAVTTLIMSLLFRFEIYAENLEYDHEKAINNYLAKFSTQEQTLIKYMANNFGNVPQVEMKTAADGEIGFIAGEFQIEKVINEKKIYLKNVNASLILQRKLPKQIITLKRIKIDSVYQVSRDEKNKHLTLVPYDFTTAFSASRRLRGLKFTYGWKGNNGETIAIGMFVKIDNNALTIFDSKTKRERPIDIFDLSKDSIELAKKLRIQISRDLKRKERMKARANSLK